MTHRASDSQHMARIEICRTEETKWTKPHQLDELDSGARLAFRSDSKQLAALTPRGEILIYDVESKQWQTTGAIELADDVGEIAISPDGSLLLTCSGKGEARLWNTGTGESVGVPMTHDGRINDCRFSADGSCVVTGSTDRTARVWHANSGEPIGSVMQHDASVSHVLVDGDHVVTASEKGHIQLWSLATQRHLGTAIHTIGQIATIYLRRDKELVVATAIDDRGTVRTWSLQAESQERHPKPNIQSDRIAGISI